MYSSTRASSGWKGSSRSGAARATFPAARRIRSSSRIRTARPCGARQRKIGAAECPRLSNSATARPQPARQAGRGPIGWRSSRGTAPVRFSRDRVCPEGRRKRRQSSCSRARADAGLSQERLAYDAGVERGLAAPGHARGTDRSWCARSPARRLGGGRPAPSAGFGDACEPMPAR